MTAVERYFFTPIYFPRSAWSVVGWWESRRMFFNAGVGVTGLVSVAVVNLLGPALRSPPEFPWGGIFVYGVMANLCYTLGPAADLLLRRVWGVRAAAVGPVLFRYGFAFSIGLSLLPIPLVMMGWLLRTVF